MATGIVIYECFESDPKTLSMSSAEQFKLSRKFPIMDKTLKNIRPNVNVNIDRHYPKIQKGIILYLAFIRVSINFKKKYSILIAY